MYCTGGCYCADHCQLTYCNPNFLISAPTRYTKYHSQYQHYLWVWTWCLFAFILLVNKTAFADSRMYDIKSVYPHLNLKIYTCIELPIKVAVYIYVTYFF